jgi:hypothetical protein
VLLLKSSLVRCLPLILAALCLVGCLSRRTRLMEERSSLLHERDQIQQPWQPQSNKQARKNAQEQLPPGDRTQSIDQRVAEIDAELLQVR